MVIRSRIIIYYMYKNNIIGDSGHLFKKKTDFFATLIQYYNRYLYNFAFDLKNFKMKKINNLLREKKKTFGKLNFYRTVFLYDDKTCWLRAHTTVELTMIKYPSQRLNHSRFQLIGTYLYEKCALKMRWHIWHVYILFDRNNNRFWAFVDFLYIRV